MIIIIMIMLTSTTTTTILNKLINKKGSLKGLSEILYFPLEREIQPSFFNKGRNVNVSACSVIRCTEGSVKGDRVLIRNMLIQVLGSLCSLIPVVTCNSRGGKVHN